jgi:hypothetical protein
MSTIAPPRPSSCVTGRAASRSRPAPTCLGSYTDDLGRTRELVSITGAGETTLVVDRIAGARGALADPRLVAHLSADEPSSNATVVAAMYLEAPRPPACRAALVGDLRAPGGEGVPPLDEDLTETRNGGPPAPPLADRRGFTYMLQPHRGALTIAELRWCREDRANGRMELVSVRAVIGALEAYEPVLGLTRAAIARHEGDAAVSVTVLRAEYERTVTSPIVLNRGLREAVERLTAEGEVTGSEVAIRCGRVRRGPRGRLSGETSWLARRIGQVPEAGSAEPTPWVHSDVLALIARDGLCLAPREAEV